MELSRVLPKHFVSAAKDAVERLHRQIPMSLWMVGKVNGDEFAVLAITENPYNIEKGDVFDWPATLCVRMSRGELPRFSPNLKNEIFKGAELSVGSYIGVPIHLESGDLFGTLCAIDSSPAKPEYEAQVPTVELAASLLTSVLEVELDAVRMQQEAHRRACEAELDPLTNLYNRRGWEKLLHAEEERCAHIGASAAVISIDLDDLKKVNDTLGHSAGDELLEKTAQAIRFAVRLTDVAGRLGGDEFAILLTDCTASDAKKAVRRIESNLDMAEINASVGLGVRNPEGTLAQAFERADAQMRANKQARKAVDRAVCFVDQIAGQLQSKS